MGKPIIRDFDTEKTILAHMPYEATTRMIGESMAQDDGIVLAGTVYTGKDGLNGVVLHDYDVSNGDVNAAILYKAVIDLNKVDERVKSALSAAKSTLPGGIVIIDNGRVVTE